MILQMFDVEHGACALLTTDIGTRMMIDCGHNASTGWMPGSYLSARGVSKLEMLCITNYDEDHVSGFCDLDNRLSIDWIMRNTSVSASDLRYLKTESGIGRNVDRLATRMAGYGLSRSPTPYFPNVTYQTFRNTYPNFDDENNLSLVLLLNVNGTKFLFPGDLEFSGWITLLSESPGLVSELPTLDVLVASHHGRESGICEQLFDVFGCKPSTILISDDYHQYDTQKTTAYYASKCKGVNFRGDRRRVITTRNDGTITFSNFTGTQYAIS